MLILSDEMWKDKTKSDFVLNTLYIEYPDIPKDHLNYLYEHSPYYSFFFILLKDYREKKIILDYGKFHKEDIYLDDIEFDGKTPCKVLGKISLKDDKYYIEHPRTNKKYRLYTKEEVSVINSIKFRRNIFNILLIIGIITTPIVCLLIKGGIICFG